MQKTMGFIHELVLLRCQRKRGQGGVLEGWGQATSIIQNLTKSYQCKAMPDHQLKAPSLETFSTPRNCQDRACIDTLLLMSNWSFITFTTNAGHGASPTGLAPGGGGRARPSGVGASATWRRSKQSAAIATYLGEVGPNGAEQ